MGLRVEVDDRGASSEVGAWMVVVDEWVCCVMDFGVFDEGACGVEGCESVSESSSQAMFSSGERAAPGKEWSSIKS